MTPFPIRRAGLALAGVLLLAAPVFARAPHVDKRHGFQITPPDGWNEIPLKVEEKWIVAKFQSNREYTSKDGYSHVPLLRVILFPKAAAVTGEAADAAKKAPEIPKEDGESVTISLENPYKDYKDYLKRNFNEGGYYVSVEKESKLGATPFTLLEVKVEKLTYGGQKHLMTWIFHGEFGDFAVEVDALEERFESIRSLLTAAFNTFRIIPRDPNAKAPEIETSGPGIKITRGDGVKETPEEQKKRLQEAEKKMVEAAIAKLPKDWHSKKTPHFLLLSHATPAFDDKVAAQAEAVRNWLDRTFGDVGSGYVMLAMIRICKTRNEESGFRKSSGDAFSSETREVVINAEPGSGANYEFQYLNAGILRQWFYDKNEDLWRSMPPWLETGLDDYVSSATIAGGLKFTAQSQDQNRLREGRRKGVLKPVKELFELSVKDMWGGEDGRYISLQCSSLVRYLLGPGAQSKKTKTLIHDYIRDLLTVVQERATREKAERDAAAANHGAELSEEEQEKQEEEAFKKRKSESWDQAQKDQLAETAKKAFGAWTDNDWKALQAGWEGWSK